MKILFLVTEDWYFWAHRLPLARKVRDMGAEVLVMTRVNRLGEALKNERFRVIPWRISRGSLNPFRELATFLQVYRAYRRFRPDIVHHFALKAVVYGGLAARLCGGIPSVNTIAGLGHVLTAHTLGMKILRRVVTFLLRLALSSKQSRAIFENPDDRKFLINVRAVGPARATVVGGAGVNVTEFAPRPEPDGVPLVLLASRLLWGKGVGEFVSAAEMLRKAGVQARFVLAGVPDPGNRSSIPESQLRAWAGAGIVEWWGHRDDMPLVLAQSNLVCLPSYGGEGVPRVLIEAAACGRATVATDVPGCREILRDGENGRLVPVRDVKALADALRSLLVDSDLRARMGARGREIAVREFSEDLVVRQTLAVYRELLGPRWPFTAAISP